ncbi:hypothetical protein [Prevotella sp. HUN102]|uniref:hypothetical protein n=1 Tax=Prevotella sp. HUN102 TaxID=1392486 RepID=UPI0012DDFB07|nr:hypothetical protein [Prevotella sp. HUN102]
MSIGFELTTKYMWRGLEYGTAPTVFSSINYSRGGFSASILGTYSLNGSHSEVDLSLGYTYKNLSVGIADYYYPSGVGEKDSYFKYDSHSTKHYVELYGTYNFNKLPIWITGSTYIFGADKGADGHQAYSTYGEVGYQHKFHNNDVLSLCCGATFNKSFYTEYSKRFSIVNVALRYMSSIKFGKFALPVSTSYIYNPYKKKSFVTFSLYLHT